MRDSEDRVVVGPLGQECPMCGEKITEVDIARQVYHDQSLEWVHMVHSVDAVKRWQREGSDEYDTPLEWDREERPDWWWSPGSGTWWSHRSQTDRVGHDPMRY